MMHYNYIGGMGIGFFYQLLIFAIFFLVVWWLIKSNPSLGKKGASNPSEILKMRLAKGEISKKEYEELKKEIIK